MLSIILIIQMITTFGTSGKDIVVKTNTNCPNIPNINYIFNDDLMCIPSDPIFKDGFNNANR